MKTPNKIELEQIAYNHSSDIDFKDLESLQKMYCKTIFFFWLLILLLRQIVL